MAKFPFATKRHNLRQVLRTFLGCLAVMYFCTVIALYLPVASLQSSLAEVDTALRHATPLSKTPHASIRRSQNRPIVLQNPTPVEFNQLDITDGRTNNRPAQHVTTSAALLHLPAPSPVPPRLAPSASLSLDLSHRRRTSSSRSTGRTGRGSTPQSPATVHSTPSTATSLFRRWQTTEVRQCNDALAFYVHQFVRLHSVAQLSDCNNSINFYVNQFARLHNVVIDRRFCVAAARGGEKLETVANQSETSEFYRNVSGCFQLSSCNVHEDPTRYRFFFANNYLNSWVAGLKTRGVDRHDVQETEMPFTIALVRLEYANLYYCIQDWYVTFLVMSFFKKSPDETNILLVDAHPRGLLDSTWSALFNSSRQLSALNPRRTQFKDLVWGITGHNSQLKSPNQYKSDPALLDEFHQFVLSRHGVPDPDVDRRLDCSNVSVLFIWRHDYVAHPRNPAGTVQRKIANEEELISSLSTRRRNLRVRGVQIDKYSMTDQLKMAAESDILIGMHGAGLSHTLFLPRHGALVELVPIYHNYENTHFADLAIWRGLAYYRWLNTDRINEVGPQLTRLPVDAMDALLLSVVTEMCSTNHSARINAFQYHEQLKQQRMLAAWMRRQQQLTRTRPVAGVDRHISPLSLNKTVDMVQLPKTRRGANDMPQMAQMKFKTTTMISRLRNDFIRHAGADTDRRKVQG